MDDHDDGSDMKGKPMFSVIIPTYNRVQLLERSVASVLSQVYEDFELIIVDDGSDDGTAAMIHRIDDERIRYIYQRRSERSAARNLGIDHAIGSYIIFMDDDDTWLDFHLDQFATAISQHEGDDIIFRTGFYRNKSDRLVPAPLYHPSAHGHPVHFAAYEMCGVWTLCIPAACLALHQFPEVFPHWQDTHLILRLFAIYDMKQLPRHSYIYHYHAAMGSKQLGMCATLFDKALINTAAIKDVFHHYGELINPFLPRDCKDYLLSKKWLEYASIALISGDRVTASRCYGEVTYKGRRLSKHFLIYRYHQIRRYMGW